MKPIDTHKSTASIRRPMARFYVAGPLFSAQDRERLEQIDAALRASGHTTFLPHRDGTDDSASRGPEGEGADERRRRIYDADLAGLAPADGVVALLDGPDCDAGTAFEIGWAVANGKPVFGLRTDFRTLGPEGPVSLMLYVACDRFVHADGMAWPEIERAIQDWAGSVKPFGGRMVRDGVPKLLRDQGREVPFRRASDTERPLAFKSKLHAAARELLVAERADEHDRLADLLEVTEAFIQSRGYDRDTLRAVKEKRWKERGGYREGWIADADAGAER